MTESEWLNEAMHGQQMIWKLREQRIARTKAGRRRCRLFACGCSRIAWNLLPDERLREAVQVAERFADGLAKKDDLASTRTAIDGLRTSSGPFADHSVEVRVAIAMAVATTEPQAFEAAFLMTAYPVSLPGYTPRENAEMALRRLIRCVFGNPFRPGAVPAMWRTATVVAVARGIYEDLAFDRMPILGDALEDAGCSDVEMLAHCRGDGPHARGCWVVDGVLGKG